MTEMLEGVFTALVTPLSEKGVDERALGELIEHQIAAGIHGLVPCGTTGESSTLSTAEHDHVVGLTVSRAAGRVPVVAGAGSNSTAEAVARTRAAREAGVDAVLHVLPYYNRPTPDGIVEHFRRVAAEGLPVVIYNIPSRSAIGLDGETYARLAEIPGVVATKEASGSLSLTEEVLAQGKLRVFSGDDALTFPLLCIGAHGVISVVSNVAPQPMVDLYDYVAEGRLDQARTQHQALLPLMNALFLETNPAPVKAALAILGLVEDVLRPPLVSVREKTRKKLEAVLKEFTLGKFGDRV